MSHASAVVVGSATLHLGDCVEVMRGLANASVDSIVTDPPYHLTTGKKGGSGPASVNLDSPYGRSRIGTGFMGMTWDGGDIAHNVAMWAECLRVLKPGGHLLAFSGTRTQHRMVCAIEDAGFEVRDQIGWLYGSGFPKSRNLDGDWQGWGTALKPAWEPICVARKPLIGTVQANVLAHGTGALNIDACRVATDDALGGGDQRSEVVSKTAGWDRPWMQDPIAKAAHAARVNSNVEKAEALGRWPANVIHDGSLEALEAFLDAPGQMANASSTAPSPKTSNVYGAMARVGEATSEARYSSTGGTNFAMKPGARRLDSGSAARFFYCAKSSRADRNEGLDNPGPIHKHGVTLRQMENAVRDGVAKGNTHPTVKPTDLMAYLCRLITPPGGVVLDPFMGSGSTGKAAIREGFRFIGIDMEPEYLAIARARIEHETAQVAAAAELVAAEDAQLPLFDGAAA